jgi:hypothetical protein
MFFLARSSRDADDTALHAGPLTPISCVSHVHEGVYIMTTFSFVKFMIWLLSTLTCMCVYAHNRQKCVRTYQGDCLV